MRTALQDNPLKKGKTLFLFDIDGTLCESRLEVKPNMVQFLKDLSQKKDIDIAVVSCTNMKNAKRELKDAFPCFKAYYTENGVVSYDKELNIIFQRQMKDLMGEEKYNNLISFISECLENAEVPFRVGHCIDERCGVINVSPVGNPITNEQREQYKIWEKEHHTVEKMRKKCQEKFGEEYKLRFTKGGVKSFDVYPMGWDKSFCLNFIKGYDNILFFGDTAYPGGGDYYLAVHDGITKGISVKNPEDTIYKASKLLKEIESL